jgi:hypothetical protein
MSSIATLNGIQYTLPGYNDTGWGANSGNVLTQYLVAIASSTLQPTGGSFTLTADVDFGANYGIKALFLKSETASPSSTGVIRLASADTIGWRANGGGSDISLSKDTSDNLKWNATKILLSGAVVNADINASAAIAYSKLALAGSIVNADIGASAAIAYSKLALTGSIVNADIVASAGIPYSKLTLTGSIVNADLTAGTIVNSAVNSAAAIAVSKLAALTVSRAVVTDASGFISAATVTATELGYLSGVTSAIQTQLNATVANPLTGNLAAGSHKITGLASGSTSGDAIAWGQAFTSGAITFSPTTTGSIGTTTNDNASSGVVGEAVRSQVGFTNFPATNNWGDLTSISLTAGDWDVSILAILSTNTATGGTDWRCGISSTTGNSGTGLTLGDNQAEHTAVLPSGGNAADSLSIPNFRVSLSGTTTYYLKYLALYTGGVPQAAGRISARRVR